MKPGINGNARQRVPPLWTEGGGTADDGAASSGSAASGAAAGGRKRARESSGEDNGGEGGLATKRHKKNKNKSRDVRRANAAKGR